MKILGIAGSPRRGGNTNRLLAEVTRGAVDKGAAVRTIFLDNLDIAACRHCDACFIAGECTINDDMQMVYRELAEADAIVLASPVHFMGVTAQAKAVIDRCQALWARKYILNIAPLGDKRQRKGLSVSVGGQKDERFFEPALSTVKSLFISLDIKYAGKITFPAVDDIDAISRQPEAFRQAYLAGQKLVTD